MNKANPNDRLQHPIKFMVEPYFLINPLQVVIDKKTLRAFRLLILNRKIRFFINRNLRNETTFYRLEGYFLFLTNPL
jgi:hypothetical protein